MPGQETVNPRTVQHTSQRRLSVNSSPDAINLTPNGEPTLMYRSDGGLYWVVKHNGVIHNLKFQSGPIRDRKDYVDISLEIQKDLLVKNDVIVNRKVGIGNNNPGGVANGLSLAPDLEIRGGIGTGAAAAGVLTLSTAETTVVDADVLGAIVFQSPLEASGTDGVLSGAAIWAEADGTFSSSVNNTELVFATNTSAAATERMRIDASGNVGIGNNNPGSILEISKVSGQPSLELSAWSATATAAHAGVLKFQKSGTATVNTFTAGDHTTAGEVLGRIEAYGVDDADGATLSSYIEFANDAISDADSSPGKIVFATSDADDAGTPTVRMTIDDDGNVGIGEIAPEGNLHISSLTDATFILEADTDNNPETDNPKIEMRQDGNAVHGLLGITGDAGTLYGNSLANTVYLESKNNNSATSNIQFVTGGDYDAPVAGSVRMTIIATGQVGIGTNAPSTNADLTLESGVLNLKETTTPTADTNYGKVYTKNDNKLYFQDGAGSEHEISFV